MIEEDASPFPIVSICSNERFDSTFAKAYHKNITTEVTSDNKTKGMEELSRDRIDLFLKRTLYNLKMLDKHFSFQQKLTNDINETVLSCLFDFLPCLSSELSWYRHTDGGTCLRFETKRKVHNEGPLNGLSIEVLLEPDNFSKGHKEHRGIEIKINNDSLEAILSEEKIVASDKKLTEITVERFYNKKLPLPYNDCIDDGLDIDSNIYQSILKGNYTYSQK